MSKKLEILNTLYDKMEEVKAHGYMPIFIALKGSQNYGMDNENSDIDTICFVYPTVDDLFYKKEVSLTYYCDNNELIDIKDIRCLVDLIKKANPSYLEILFSEYLVPFDSRGKEFVEFLQKNKEELAAGNKSKLLRTCIGTINSKIKNLYHNSPAREADIKEYGYCLKEIHHAYRLMILLTEYFKNNKSFEDSLVPQEPHKTFLLTLKEVPQNLEKVNELEEKVKESVDELYNEFSEVEFEINEELFSDLKNRIFDLVVEDLMGK